MKKVILFLLFTIYSLSLIAQINTDRVLTIGRNALYFEDYVLSIQYFNQVIKAKPWLAEPYFYRAVAKIQLDDYKGAEEDCTLCLERNPFLVQAWFARGIAFQSQGLFDEAIADYRKGLEFRPTDRQMLVNMAVAFIQQKDYDGAEPVFEELISNHPNYSANYLSRGAMYLEKGDTISAINDYNKAIEIDPYYAPNYGNRAIILFQTEDYQGALSDLNEAIRLSPRENAYYINRGLVRYNLNDLRGAMADYDQVINLDRDNLIARFNRGLLRYQVGDYNRAISDFDVVIDHEPDNFMAYYNRALLKYETGNYIGSIDDLDVVLDEYPNFIPGYYSRADARSKAGDRVGAERDQWTAFEIEQRLQKERADRARLMASSGGSISSGSGDSGLEPEEDIDEEAEKKKTREQSDKSISKFNRMVVYDKDKEQQSKYQSDVRGRVQDKNVRVDIEPQFVLTYYEKPDPIKNIIYFNKSLEEYNSQMILSRVLRITNEEAALTEDQIAIHFASINDYSANIEADTLNPDNYFGRAIDFMLVQDFTEAMKDYDQVVKRNPDFFMGYFNRAVVRYKQLEYLMAQGEYEQEDTGMSMTLNATRPQRRGGMPSANTMRDNKRAFEYDQIIRDYDKAIELNPDFAFTYFNRGNVRCAQRDYQLAILDYSQAIERNPDFAEAYFNRGLTRLAQGDVNRGIADLSKSGELGIANAYSIIKRMTSN